MLDTAKAAVIDEFVKATAIATLANSMRREGTWDLELQLNITKDVEILDSAAFNAAVKAEVDVIKKRFAAA